MPDYKEMYLHLMRETEKSIRILVEAQRECERMYLEAEEPQFTLLTFNQADASSAQSWGAAFFAPLAWR